jgi:anhydro-N-acetylmuramic acid kinase
LSAALYIGLMSGTSLDGVDAALVDFSGPMPVTLATHFAAFAPALRESLAALQSPGPNELEHAALAANDLMRAYAEGVRAVLSAAGVAPDAVRAIGAHGQTVRHRPERGYTIQLANPALLAELTGIAVVADFRSRDVAAGGQGAPLAPAFHRAVFGMAGRMRAVVNVGGIANVTLLPPDGATRGFDTGPGNVLMDGWHARHRGGNYDAGGVWAASGRAHDGLLARLLAEPYFARPAPKSTGRDLFDMDWLDRQLAGFSDIAPQDVQATLLDLSARTIAEAVAGSGAQSLHVCGGGAHNVRLLERLGELLRPMTVAPTEALGVPADWVEAVAFAWLARCRVDSIPLDLSAITGASGPRTTGGIFAA